MSLELVMRTVLGSVLLLLPLLCPADVVVPVESVESYVNIRLDPEADTDIIGRLQKGIPLRLVRTVPGWHEVELDDEGTTGFVSSDWSTVVVDEPAPEPDVEVAEEPEPEADVEVAEEPEPEPDIEVPGESGPEPVAEVAVEPEPEPVIETVEESEQGDSPEVAVDAAEEPELPVEEVAEEPEPAAAAAINGTPDFLVKFKKATSGTDSQIFDNGNRVGIGTTEPEQRLEVNGNIQIHEQNSSVAGLMITQSSGETGYIMHNRASTLTIGAGSVDRLTIDRNGNLGVGVSRPEHPLELASGAHVTAGGVWTNSSSRENKENISELTVADALAALAELQPVQFNYKSDSQEDYVGFIAEDVPELVATADREGLSTMDVVAVLTKVIQAQQQQIEALEIATKELLQDR
jgi:hypothetical protein